MNTVEFEDGDQEFFEKGLEKNFRIVFQFTKLGKYFSKDVDTMEELTAGKKSVCDKFSKDNFICTFAEGTIGKVTVVRMCAGFPNWT